MGVSGVPRADPQAQKTTYSRWCVCPLKFFEIKKGLVLPDYRDGAGVLPGKPLSYVERPWSLFMARRTARPAFRALSSLRAICLASSTTTRAALAADSLTWGLEASFCAASGATGVDFIQST